MCIIKQLDPFYRDHSFKDGGYCSSIGSLQRIGPKTALASVNLPMSFQNDNLE